MANNISENSIEILKQLGNSDNIVRIYNCMTRLRVQLINKDIIDLKTLKDIPIVKGARWNGEELQIIIGPEVTKVKMELEKTLKKDETGNEFINGPIKGKYKTKMSFFVFINGVVSPLLPIIVAAGLLIGFKSICESFGWIESVSINYSITDLSSLITQYNLFTAMVYMLSQIGIGFVGLLFCISTVKFMGGNVVVGAFIALTLASPMLYPGLEFKLFSIGDVNISVKAYCYSILPQIGAALMYVYFDRILQKYIPSNIDLIFRCLIEYLVICLVIWFVVGPIFGLVESGAYYLIKELEDVPLGIGMAVAGFLWMPLVLTGTHQAIATLITISINNGDEATAGLIMIVPTFAQLGASIAVLMRTKNLTVKNLVYGGLVPGVCGVIEPLLYSTNLQKRGSFLAGCIGGAVAMMVAGILNVTLDASGPLGVFSIAGAIGKGWENIVLYILIWVIALGVGFGIAFLFYRERINENKSIKNINKSIIKKLNISNDNSLVNELNNVLYSNDDLELIKNIENKILKMLKVENKFQSLKRKEKDTTIIESELNIAKEEIGKLVNSLNDIQINKSDKLENIYEQIQNKFDVKKIAKLKLKYSKSINSLNDNYNV